MLYKYKKNKKWQVWKGYYVEKKSLLKLIEEMKESGKKIYILDKKGEDIRNLNFDIFTFSGIACSFLNFKMLSGLIGIETRLDFSCKE